MNYSYYKPIMQQCGWIFEEKRVFAERAKR